MQLLALFNSEVSIDNMVAVLIYERRNTKTYCCEPLEISSLILKTCHSYVNNNSK